MLALMMEADLDHNGTIEFPEFLQLMKEKYGRDDLEADLRLIMLMLLTIVGFSLLPEQYTCFYIREAFNMFDRDKDGFIDVGEFKTVILMF